MCEDIEAPEDLLGPEWGEGAFRSVFGRTYTPKVWGKHRALNHNSLKQALRIAEQRDCPELVDTIAALIWQAGIVGNRAECAFDVAEEWRKRAVVAEDELEKRGR